MRNKHLKQVGPAIALATAIFGLAASAVAFARFDGGVAFVWPASGLMLAFLTTEKPPNWPVLIIACGSALVLEVATVGLGWRAVPVLAPALLGEPVLAAVLLSSFLKVDVDTQSVRGTASFLLVAGILAPLLSGIPAAWAVTAASHTSFKLNLIHWVAAHGLGAIIFTPVFTAFATGDALAYIATGDRLRGAKTAGLLGVVAMTSWAVFRQSTMPLLFLPLLPMVYAALQGGRAGAALGVMILAAIGAVHTIAGNGPIHLLTAGAGAKSLFLQAYVACAALAVLPIAALLAERTKLISCWQESEARFRTMAESLGDTVVDIAPNGIIRYVSPSISEIADLPADALLGTPAHNFISKADRLRVVRAYRIAVERPEAASIVQYRGPTRNAEHKERWYEASLRALVREGDLVGVLGSVRDVSERKAVELSLVRDASIDPLTGILNRRAFMQDLEARCGQIDARDGRGSVALFDLDHFKQINDCYGHAAGDTVLKQVAEAATSTVRGHDRVGRIGGEEFAILFWDADLEASANAAERVRSAVQKLTFVSDTGQQFGITTSLGLAPLSANLSATDLLKQADTALYDAKKAGRNCVRVAA